MCITTAFSGLGTVEHCVRRAHENISDLARMRRDSPDGTSGEIIEYSASGILPQSQTVLQCLKHPPRHRFRDLMHRVPEAVRLALRESEERALSYTKYLAEEWNLKAMDAVEYQEARLPTQRQFLLELRGVLRAVDRWPTAAPCAQHGTSCPISPRGQQGCADKLWVEAGGNTWCPWSPTSPNKRECRPKCLAG